MTKIFKIEWEGEEEAICKTVLEAIIYKEYETGRRLQRVEVTGLPEPKKKLEKLNVGLYYHTMIADKINEIIDKINEEV